MKITFYVICFQRVAALLKQVLIYTKGFFDFPQIF